jgi:DNA-binding NarL/FixJ family response regulator
MTTVEKELQELALSNWDEFVKITKLNTRQFEICKLKKKGLSLGQISQKMKISTVAVLKRCKVC